MPTRGRAGFAGAAVSTTEWVTRRPERRVPSRALEPVRGRVFNVEPTPMQWELLFVPRRRAPEATGHPPGESRFAAGPEHRQAGVQAGGPRSPRFTFLTLAWADGRADRRLDARRALGARAADAGR